MSLTMSTDRIGIGFATRMTAGDRASQVALHPDLLEVDERLSPDGVAGIGRTLVRVQPGKSATDIEGLINSLSRRSDIDFATPVFQARSGFDELLTDMFYASFPASTPAADIENLNEQHAVEFPADTVVSAGMV